MKLTRRHIGKLVDVHSSDGSWVYQLVDIRKGVALFYSYGDEKYWTENVNKHNDWRLYSAPKPWPWVERGWQMAKEIQP